MSTILYVPVGEGTRGSAVEASLQRRILNRQDLELRDLTSLDAEEDDEAGEERGDPEGEAAVHLRRAEEAFSRFDYAGATSALDAALTALRPLAIGEAGRERLAGVHLERAVVLLVHGEAEAAAEELRTCLHLSDGCAPDPGLHPPEVVALYEAVRSTRTERSGSLLVRTVPEDARVRLDGGPTAASPRFEAPAGRHYLSVERDGYQPRVEVVQVVAGTVTERRVELLLGSRHERAGAARRELTSRGVDADAFWRAEAARLAASDFVVLAEVGAETLRVGVYDGRGAPVRDPLEGRPDEGAARDYLDLSVPAPVTPFYGQWWFWTPIALGLSALVALGVAALVVPPNVRLVVTGVEYE